jgi:dihydrofolate synthase / folylpolyglutamate synthase
MTYQEATDFLFSSLPMYQRIGSAAYKANLDNTLALDAYFSHPHRCFPTIHVAGTNGKGSVSHMLASVFQEAGYRTGLYTSPHLLDFRERIRVNGDPVSEEEVVSFVTGHREAIDRVSPSFFEMTVAMAFDHFRTREVEMAVIEVGMGGRLDSTNIITPVVSVITNISPDHTEFLGKDLDSIAREKGGIIKPGVPLVVGNTGVRTEQLLSSLAHSLKAPVFTSMQRYEPVFATLTAENHLLIRYRTGVDPGTNILTIESGLTGQYQVDNVATVLTVTDLLPGLGWELPGRAVRQGIARVIENTGILGRWQTIGHHPRSICDTAHNQAGVESVVGQILQVPFRKLHMVWGMVGDKDIGAILPLLPKVAEYYFTRSGIPRAMDANLLRLAGEAAGLKGRAYPTVAEAYRAAMVNAGPEDLVFTGGSTFVVADLLKSLGQA